PSPSSVLATLPHYTHNLSLHDALPISIRVICSAVARAHEKARLRKPPHGAAKVRAINRKYLEPTVVDVTHPARNVRCLSIRGLGDRKSTRLNSSHGSISYAVFSSSKQH